MKKIYFPVFFSFLLLSQLLMVNCKKDTGISSRPTGPVPKASDINQFIWGGMHDYYLWVDQVPNLSSSKYNNQDTLNRFLNQYSDPEKLFYDLLYKYKEIDKWSFISNSLKSVEDWISGTSKTTGIDFMLARIGTSNNVFGFVRYVIKGSPADLAGVKRGDLFLKVDDQQITVSNYQTLLLAKDSYKLTFATITNGTIAANNKSVSLQGIEMQENPILLDTVYQVNGANVGYLVYNQFNSDFDLQLNNVFKKFKDQGVTKLILDLRYNGGGAVESAIYLASMIYSTDKTKLFIKSSYNQLLQNYFVKTYGAAALNDYFTDKIQKTDKTAEAPINSLGINDLYVITSDNTASASELLINGLKPYINVKEIGIETVGKYVGSTTLQDMDSTGKVNPNDPWVMQPIVVKIANSQGVTDYVNGLTPDIRAEEDIANLLPFGDPNETLLQASLNYIKGLPQKSLQLKSAELGMKKVVDPRQLKPFAKDMYVNPAKLHQLTKDLGLTKN
jgi:C-terminal processing protease CtpA/Prc